MCTPLPPGLKLKLQSQTAHLQCFSYALFPTMERSCPVGWQYLVTEHEEAENIRLHQISEGDNLGALLEEFKQSYAKAVVFINTEDSYELGEGLVSSVQEVPFPLLVVKKSDGEEIVRCLERHVGDCIYARVDAENQVDEVDRLPPQATAQAQKGAEQQVTGSISKGVSTITIGIVSLEKNFKISGFCDLEEKKIRMAVA